MQEEIEQMQTIMCDLQKVAVEAELKMLNGRDQFIAEFLERTGRYVTNEATRRAVVAAAVAAERERGASLCEKTGEVMSLFFAGGSDCDTVANECAAEIRKG